MKVEKIDVTEINILSDLIRDYINEDPKLAHLYDYSKNIGEFKRVIENKSKENINREVLATELSKQYESLENTDLVLENVKLLRQENTFTITTAHQLCLFTGPLYFVYKSISVIKLSMLLKKEYPDYNFVPVFWLGSEDHDFEEINHLNIYDKKISWESGQTGAVGRMKNTNISKTISQLSKVLFGGKEHELINYLKSTFKDTDLYVKSFIRFIHKLFGQYGLVVLEQDNVNLKRLFTKEIGEEIFNNLIEKSIIKEVDFLEKDYKVQAKPRSINIFYMVGDIRERIVYLDNKYSVLNTDILFSQNELLEELKNHPDRFSPNVLLRPLYQESILPNLAYVGGGGELAYWLELKNLFHSQQRKMPMLLLRDMALIIDAKTAENIDKIAFDKKCLFKNKDLFISELVKSNSSKEISVLEELNTLRILYKSLLDKTTNIDKSLDKHVLAQENLAMKSVLNIEKKMLRALKKRESVLVARLVTIKDTLFPNGNLQERYDNILPYYKKYDSDLFDLLISEFNPLDAQIKLVIEDE